VPTSFKNVFDGGRRRSEIRLASAKNVELLEAYASTVLGAMRDVEDGLAGVNLTARQYKSLDESRKRAQRLADMSAIVVERGGMDFVQLFQIQSTVLAAEDAAINGHYDQLRASIDLYKAIGGGSSLTQIPAMAVATACGGCSLAEAAEKSDSAFSPAPEVGIDAAGAPATEVGGKMAPLMPSPRVLWSSRNQPWTARHDKSAHQTWDSVRSALRPGSVSTPGHAREAAVADDW